MTTVVEARTRRGDVIGRCTAKCHTAKGQSCYCICGGVNHGVGLEQARENIWARRLTLDPDVVYVTRLSQLPLFSQEQESEHL